MLKNSIVSKMLLKFVSLITIVFLLLAFFVSFLYRNFLIKSKLCDLNTRGEFISNFAIDYVNNPSSEYIRYLSNYIEAVSSASNVDIILSDALDYVYLVSNDVHKGLLGKRFEELSDFYFKESKESFVSSNVYDKDIGEKVYRVVKPLYESNI